MPDAMKLLMGAPIERETAIATLELILTEAKMDDVLRGQGYKALYTLRAPAREKAACTHNPHNKNALGFCIDCQNDKVRDAINSTDQTDCAQCPKDIDCDWPHCKAAPEDGEVREFKESCWLIEGAGIYWGGRSADHFTRDVAEAVRFDRQQDAERVRCWLIPEAQRQLCRTAEHMFSAIRAADSRGKGEKS